MKTTIKFFTAFLIFIFLSTCLQAQTPKNGSHGDKNSAYLNIQAKQNNTPRQQRATEFARRAEIQKRKAIQKQKANKTKECGVGDFEWRKYK